MSLTITTFAVLSILWCSAFGNQQHLVCTTVEDIFSEGGQTDSTQSGRQLRGPPGRRGIPGIEGRRGLPGPRGPPAIVDYRRIDSIIDEKIASALADFKLQINSILTNSSFNLTVTTGTTNGSVSRTTATACSNEGLFYDGKCFTLPGYSTASNHMDYNAAKSECAKHGALLAEVHDRAQQDALINYIRSRYLWSGRTVEVWVGMEYQKSTSTLLYRSGEQVAVNQFQWWPSYPLTETTTRSYGYGKQVGVNPYEWLPYYPVIETNYKYMAIDVNPLDQRSDGLWNTAMNTYLHGVICEKVI